ncbi:Protein R06A4.2 [Aphelenchoides avenae]|nr:Protein R06A4.2 [Aphelenchus avenae]
MDLPRAFKKRSPYTALEERQMWHYVASQYNIGDRGFGPAFWKEFRRNHPVSKTPSSLESHFRKKMVPRVHEASIDAEDVFKLMRHFKVILDESAQQRLKRKFGLDRIDVGRGDVFLWAHKRLDNGELTQYPRGYQEGPEDDSSDSSSTSDIEDVTPDRRPQSSRHRRSPSPSRTPSPRHGSQRQSDEENAHAQERSRRAVKVSPGSSPPEFQAPEFSPDIANDDRPGCSRWLNSRKRTRSPKKALFTTDCTLPLQPVMKPVKTSPSLKPHIGGLRSHPTRKRSEPNFDDEDRLQLLQFAKGQLSLDKLPDAIKANKSWEVAMRRLFDGASVPQDASSAAVGAERANENVDTAMDTSRASDAAVARSKEL